MDGLDTLDRAADTAARNDPNTSHTAWNQAADDAGLHQGSAPALEQHWYDRPLGVLQAVGGVGETALGGALLAAPEPTGLTKIGGAVVGLHGLDDIQAGLRTAWTGHSTETVTQQAVTGGAKALGATPGAAVAIGAVVDGGLGMANPEGEAGKLVRGGVELNEAEHAVKATSEAAGKAKKAVTAEKPISLRPDGYTDTNPPVRIDHLDGEINARGKAVGFHSRPNGADPATARITKVVNGKDANGIYTGKVEVQNPADGAWVGKRANSSFFPDNLSADQITKAGLHAFHDSGVTQDGKFVGDSGLGFKVEGWYRNGKIESFYPLQGSTKP